MVSRAQEAAATIAAEAARAGAGARLGSRADLRAMCGVSVGSLHEALRILQSTGEILVRSGPGGGVFAAEQTALGSLLQWVRAQALVEPDFIQAARVLNALAPLAIADAIDSIDDPGEERLRHAADRMARARREGLDVFVRASLEVFAILVLLPERNILSVIAGAVIQIQISALPGLAGPVNARWSSLVDDHAGAVARLVTAVCDRDRDVALDACRDRRFIGIYAAMAGGKLQDSVRTPRGE